MKSKKETIKSIVLTFLILLSLFMSYVVATYKPEYEIFSRKMESKEKNDEVSILSSLNVLAPSLIVKNEAFSREEVAVQNSITKISTVDAIKDRSIIKEILLAIHNDSSVEVRIKNDDSKEIVNSNQEKYTMNYDVILDSSLIKPIFFKEDNTNISLDFDTVTITKNKPNTIYIHKKGGTNYIQVELKNNVYDIISKYFDENKSRYGKYQLNDKFIYLKEDQSYYSYEYSTEDVDINKIGREVSQDGNNFKGSGGELTDGYSILRETENRIIYINPSNEIKKPTTIMATTAYSINFLVESYLDNISYQITKTTDSETLFQEVYKDSLVFSKDNLMKISVLSNSTGVYQALMPKKVAKTLLSSKKVGFYEIERSEYVMNYLYSNVNLKNVEDIIVGRERVYNKANNSYTYSPKWYIKYKGEYITFAKIKEAVIKGEI